MTPATITAHQAKVGLTLALIQLFFTLTWTVYVIFLPQLAAQMGLAKDMALVIGRTGREGLVTGTLFSLLALAAFARMALVASQLNMNAQVAPLLGLLPVAAWTVAGLLLLALVWQQKQASVPSQTG